MSNKFHQISFKEIFSDCQDMFIDDVPSFFDLLEEHLDISSFIPDSFFSAFYRSLGRKRVYPLTGFLSALILQKIFSIPTDSILIIFLKLCKELRDFCGFTKVPDAPLLTRFKQDFLPFIEDMFNKLVDFTEPICKAVDSSLSDILAFDTSGIELYVAENNPKALNTLIRKLKAYYKDKPEVDPYKMAYGLMPSRAASSPDAKQHTIDTYGFLKDEFHFSKVLIPYNPRNESSLDKVGYNSYGYPTCPKDSSLDMKYLGLCHEKGRADRYKWGCPKMHMSKGQWICDCKSPCSNAKKGRTTYTYENLDFRMFPGIQRDSDEWDSLYKVRTTIERTINHFKINMCIAGRRTRNHATTKADVFLAGIASQLTAIVAHSMKCPKYIRSLKPLIA